MYICIYIYIYTVNFLYFTFFYLAEAFIIMPSLRNHILFVCFLIWLRHFLGIASLRNLSFLLPLNTKIKNRPRQRPKFEFLIVLATIISLIPKSNIRPCRRPKFDFFILLVIISSKYHNCIFTTIYTYK